MDNWDKAIVCLSYAIEKFLQEHISKLFQTTLERDLQQMRKLLGRKYYCAQDICGRNVLHLAVLCRSRSLVEYLASHHPQLLNMQDNVRYRSRPDVERLDPEKEFRDLGEGCSVLSLYQTRFFSGGGGSKCKTHS